MLESKTTGSFNQNKKSKQLDRPDAVRKLYFTLKYLNSTINKTFYICPTESLLLRNNKISKKAVEIAGFLQFGLHIFLVHESYF